MSALTGRTFGRYLLEELLGRGGMAEVYRATDTKLARSVAVKVIHRAHASDAQFLERFLREARMVASLEHPNVLPIYDFGEEDGLPYLVMPYLDGGTLRDRMKGTPFSLGEAALLVRQLADALDAAHDAQILHRDVKPANVLIGKGERLVLADFGIAKMLESSTGLTATGMVVGTPIYMAPEQAQGKPASPATDRYALAVLSYELIAGTPPFMGESALSLMHQHVTQPAPMLSTKIEGLPTGLDAVFERALSKDPAQRPPTCRSLSDALAAFAPLGARGGLSATAQAWISSQDEDPTAPTKIQQKPVTHPDAATAPARRASDTSSPTVIHVPGGAPSRSASGSRLTSEATVVSRATPSPLARYGVPLAAALAAAAVVLLVSRREERGAGPGPIASARSTPLPAAAPARPVEATHAPASAPTVPSTRTQMASAAATPDVLVVERPLPTRPAARDVTPPPAALEARRTGSETVAPPEPPNAPSAPAAPPAVPPAPAFSTGRELGADAGLAQARQRVDPFRGERPKAVDYELALAEARRALEERPRREDARFLAAYAQGGLDYIGLRDAEAGAAIAGLARVMRRAPMRELALLLRSSEGRTPSGWQLALAYGDSRGEAEALLAADLSRNPNDPRALFGRATLRRMQGRHEDAVADALKVVPLAQGAALEAGVAEFLGDESERLARYEDAVRWYRTCVATPGAPPMDTASAAYRAAMTSRNRLHREAEALELFRTSCTAGNAEACSELGDEPPPMRPRDRLRRRFGVH